MVTKVLGALLGILLGIAAYVQLDDPDRAPWMAVYGAASIIALSYVLRPRSVTLRATRRGIAIGIAVVALAWMVQLVPRLVEEGIALDHEVSREAGGLLLAGAGLLALALAGGRVRVVAV